LYYTFVFKHFAKIVDLKIWSNYIFPARYLLNSDCKHADEHFNIVSQLQLDLPDYVSQILLNEVGGGHAVPIIICLKIMGQSLFQAFDFFRC